MQVQGKPVAMTELTISPSSNLPAEYQDRPAAYLARRLQSMGPITSAQRTYLKAILAALRVTESRQECDLLEGLLQQLPSRN